MVTMDTPIEIIHEVMRLKWALDELQGEHPLILTFEE